MENAGLRVIAMRRDIFKCLAVFSTVLRLILGAENTRVQAFSQAPRTPFESSFLSCRYGVDHLVQQAHFPPEDACNTLWVQ